MESSSSERSLAGYSKSQVWTWAGNAVFNNNNLKKCQPGIYKEEYSWKDAWSNPASLSADKASAGALDLILGCALLRGCELIGENPKWTKEWSKLWKILW